VVAQTNYGRLVISIAPGKIVVNRMGHNQRCCWILGNDGLDIPIQALKIRFRHLADDLNGKFNHLIEDVQALMDKDLTFFQRFALFRGGCLSDRVGTKKALLIFDMVAMCGFAPVILIPTWQAVPIGAVLFVSWSAIYQPATMSLMYKVRPQNKRTMGVSMHSLSEYSVPQESGYLAEILRKHLHKKKKNERNHF